MTSTSPHLTHRPLAHLESQVTQEAPRPDQMTRDTAIRDRRSSPQASPEGRKRRLGPASAPWWEARGREGRSACRASPIGARSRLQPPRPRPLRASLGRSFSPLPASLGNALLGIRKRHLHCPEAARLGAPAMPSIPAWRPGAPACPAPPLLSPPLPKSLVFKTPALGTRLVQLRGAGVSEAVWLGVRCPVRVTRIPRGTQPPVATLAESGPGHRWEP